MVSVCRFTGFLALLRNRCYSFHTNEVKASHFDPRGGYSHTLPIRVCAAQRGNDFEAPDLERGIHFRGVF